MRKGPGAESEVLEEVRVAARYLLTREVMLTLQRKFFTYWAQQGVTEMFKMGKWYEQNACLERPPGCRVKNGWEEWFKYLARRLCNDLNGNRGHNWDGENEPNCNLFRKFHFFKTLDPCNYFHFRWCARLNSSTPTHPWGPHPWPQEPVTTWLHMAKETLSMCWIKDFKVEKLC